MNSMTSPQNVDSFINTVTNSSNFNYVINDNFYIFSVTIYTFDGRLKDLNPQAIVKLSIEDDLTTPFHKGVMILDNSFDNIEQTNLETQNQKDRGFILKGDCRDILKIKIMPKLTEGSDLYDEETKKYFLLDFEFVIYHEEDSPGSSIANKTKTFYFWDLHYEILREKNSYFSTANIINTNENELQINTNPSSLSNGDRSAKTGKAVQELLRQTLNKEENINVGFDKDFDQGASTLFFSSPAQFKSLDSLNYLVNLHISDVTYDPCILRLERYPKQFTFTSLSKYFANAVTNDGAPGKYYLENLQLAGYYSNQDSINYTITNNFSPKYAPYFRTLGNIMTYSFDNMSGELTQDEILATAVHYYGYTDKMFEIDYEENSAQTLFGRMETLFASPFKSQTLNITPGELRITNKNIKNVFYALESTSDQRLSLGRSNAFYDYVMNSNVVIFRLYGSTHRQAGRFISISRSTTLPVTDFDNKILGTYFIVNVKHVFENATYYNDLVCVKTYANSNIFLTPKTL